MLCDLGLKPDDAAKMLHVTPRTIRNWISGKALVPYAAYKLVRVFTGAELPMPGWDGWHMHSGKLWTPEGHGFTPADSGWWSNLVRRSHLFHVLYERQLQLDTALNRMRQGDAQLPVGGSAVRDGKPAAASRQRRRAVPSH